MNDSEFNRLKTDIREAIDDMRQRGQAELADAGVRISKELDRLDERATKETGRWGGWQWALVLASPVIAFIAGWYLHGALVVVVN